MRRPEPFPPATILVVIHQPTYDHSDGIGVSHVWHAFPVGTLVVTADEYAEDTTYSTITCRPLGSREITQQVMPKYLALPNSPAGKRAYDEREENEYNG